MVGVQQANLIPEEMRSQHAHNKLQKKLIRILGIYCFVILFITTTVFSVTYYLNFYSDLDVPPQIKAEYEAAIAGDELLMKKRSLLQSARNEDCDAIQTLANIISKMPEGTKLTRVNIAQSIQIEGFSYDPSASNLFVGNINALGYFRASPEKISSSNGVNTFVIKAEKLQ